MPAYRFCRTDDIPLLTDALNACYFVQFPDQSPLSLADFKREIRELNVWSSSCMIASEDGKPIAVVTGAKREHETLIHRIAVHDAFKRRGHATHLLESLCHKVSVLGPPKIIAEIPNDQPAVRELFETVGFAAEDELVDYRLAEPLEPARDERSILAVGLDELLRDRVLKPRAPCSWERAPETLQNRKDQIQGYAIALDSRVNAYALFRDLRESGRREIVALGIGHGRDECDPQDRAHLECVIRAACQTDLAEVTIPKISCSEVPRLTLESLGFCKTRSYTRFTDLPGSRMH